MVRETLKKVILGVARRRTAALIIWVAFICILSLSHVHLFRDSNELALVALNSGNDAITRVSRIKDDNHDRSTGCLKRPTDGTDKECWNAFRRQQYLKVINDVYNWTDDELKRFNPDNESTLNKRNWHVFDLIAPTYHCDANSLRRIGAPGEGGKWLCGPIHVLGPKCVVFSLGSYNMFDFEEGIHNYTRGQCEIHTFDCSGVWSNPTTTFHPWCIGFDGQDDKGNTYKRLSTAAKELGVTSISLLKMDIEHGEYDVFQNLKDEPEEFLPDQILFELHTRILPKHSKRSNWARIVIDLVRDIDAMGYSFAFEERNLLCDFCCEYVIVRDRHSSIHRQNPKLDVTLNNTL